MVLFVVAICHRLTSTIWCQFHCSHRLHLDVMWNILDHPVQKEKGKKQFNIGFRNIMPTSSKYKKNLWINTHYRILQHHTVIAPEKNSQQFTEYVVHIVRSPFTIFPFTTPKMILIFFYFLWAFRLLESILNQTQSECTI